MTIERSYALIGIHIAREQEKYSLRGRNRQDMKLSVVELDLVNLDVGQHVFCRYAKCFSEHQVNSAAGSAQDVSQEIGNLPYHHVLRCVQTNRTNMELSASRTNLKND